MPLRDWLKARRIVEAEAPAEWTSKRPNDQRMFNFIMRWRYDQVLAELTGKADFCQVSATTDKHIVLAASAIPVDWMSSHPGCGVACWDRLRDLARDSKNLPSKKNLVRGLVPCLVRLVRTSQASPVAGSGPEAHCFLSKTRLGDLAGK